MARLVALLFVNYVFAIAASPVYAAPATFSDFELVIGNIIKILAPAAALAFLAMVIVGAYKFITSGGDPKGTAGARMTLTYALLGVLLVAAAILILRVVKQLTGADVLNVNIPIN